MPTMREPLPSPDAERPPSANASSLGIKTGFWNVPWPLVILTGWRLKYSWPLAKASSSSRSRPVAWSSSVGTTPSFAPRPCFSGGCG